LTTPNTTSAKASASLPTGITGSGKSRTREETTLKLLRRGWLSALDSATKGGVLSLAQRVSEWRRDGMVINDRWKTSDTGARFKQYRIVKPTRWTA
jgi:hypothetical protein